MSSPSPSVLIIEARFYDDISDELAEGAIAELTSSGVAYERVAVPGALEIPVAFAMAVSRGVVGPAAKHQGVIALGCVIRGETSHYDIVANESARGLMQLGVDHAIPVGNGILTVDSRAQADARASIEGKNKGKGAAAACLALMELSAGWSG